MTAVEYRVVLAGIRGAWAPGSAGTGRNLQGLTSNNDSPTGPGVQDIMNQHHIPAR